MPGFSDVGLDQEKTLVLLDKIYSTVVIRDILEKGCFRSYTSEKDHNVSC